MVKNLPAVQQTRVQSLGWEDPLEKGMATHSSILAWRIPMDREAWQPNPFSTLVCVSGRFTFAGCISLAFWLLKVRRERGAGLFISPAAPWFAVAPAESVPSYSRGYCLVTLFPTAPCFNLAPVTRLPPIASLGLGVIKCPGNLNSSL